MSGAAPGRPVRLHVLKLPESPVADGTYDRFDHHWFLDDPQAIVRPGDVVSLPELLTGAGEFEGVRFACVAANNRVQLVGAGVEMPEFPQAIVDFAAQRGASLRELYHSSLDQILLAQGLSMEVVCEGCDDGPDGYWGGVAAGHCVLQPPRRPKNGEWIISIPSCTQL